MANSVVTTPTEQLQRAVHLRLQIDSLTRELRQILSALPSDSFERRAPRRRSNLSAEGRQRIAAAQRLRWARFKAARGNTRRSRPLSRHLLTPEGRARVSAAVKARWQRYRAAKAALAA